MNNVIGLLKEVMGAIYKEQRLFPCCSLRQIKRHRSTRFLISTQYMKYWLTSRAVY